MDHSRTTARSPIPHAGGLRSRYSPSVSSYAESLATTSAASSVRLVKSDSLVSQPSATLRPPIGESHWHDVQSQTYGGAALGGQKRLLSAATSASDCYATIKQNPRLPAKFPLPRAQSSMGKALAVASKDRPAWIDSSREEVAATVRERILAHEQAEFKAKWSRAKWLLLLSVLLVRFT